MEIARKEQEELLNSLNELREKIIEINQAPDKIKDKLDAIERRLRKKAPFLFQAGGRE